MADEHEPAARAGQAERGLHRRAAARRVEHERGQRATGPVQQPSFELAVDEEGLETRGLCERDPLG